MLSPILRIVVITALPWLTPAGAASPQAIIHSNNDEPVILILGDSLSAGYGIDIERSWVSLLEHHLGKLGVPGSIVNASISGETTQGGLRRLPALLEQHSVDTMVLALGANDGLRGHNVEIMQSNLQQMIQLAQARGARVLLVGMHIPPNYGRRYTSRFHQAFLTLAQQERVALLPFLLDDVATEASLMQPDGLHPNADAQAQILANVLDALLPLLADPAHSQTGAAR